MGDDGKLAGVHGSGDSGHPNRNRTHEKDLQAITNSLGYRNRDGGHVGVAFHGGAMNGGSDACRYGILGPYLMNRRHGEKEELIASREEVNTGSGTVLRGRVVDGGDKLEREKGAGEEKSEQ